jgi:hypothetical protein
MGDPNPTNGSTAAQKKNEVLEVKNEASEQLEKMEQLVKKN